MYLRPLVLDLLLDIIQKPCEYSRVQIGEDRLQVIWEPQPVMILDRRRPGR